MTAPTTTAPAVAPFFADADFDYEFRCALGGTAHGVGDPGMWLAMAAGIVDGDRSSWFAAWTARGDQLSALAPELSDPEAAGWAWLSASGAYSRALNAVDGLPPEEADTVLLPTFRRGRSCWDAMIDLSAGRHLRVDVPYEGSTLPAYLLRPDGTGAARPTVVLTNGSDGSLSSMWAAGVAGSLARGWNALVYDGPGQQSMLFEREVPFRPDWEAVLTPVVDALVDRPDVDERALMAYGISQAGYWLTRALAFENRFAAAAVDPGVVDVSTSWTTQLLPEMIALLDSGQKDLFDHYMSQMDSDPARARTYALRARPYGITDPYDLFTAVRGYQLRDVADRVGTPLLITDPDGEQFWPGQSEELASLLTGEHELARFTATDGADRHCQPLAPNLTQSKMFSWLAEHLPASR
ncbi:MAG: hypothetical protein JOY78_11510 [Pseudonocardia sp.]|nr:hypothetical protein [Pseudonocardia sp.]